MDEILIKSSSKGVPWELRHHRWVRHWMFRIAYKHDYFWAINMINKLTVLFKEIPASVRGIPLSTL